MAVEGFCMKHRPLRSRTRDLLDRIKRLLKREPEPPEDPYAMVGAPKKPGPPVRSRAAEAPLD